MRPRSCISAAIFTWAWYAVGFAANSIVIESKSVPANATDVTVGVHIENDFNMTAVVLPLEFRSVTPGAFIADTVDIAVQGRLAVWEIEGAGFTVKEYFDDREPWPYYHACPVDSTGNVWLTADSGLDFVSPDAILYVGFSMDSGYIAPGDDGVPGQGVPSLLLTFNVSGTAGTFVIDSTCTPPGNILAVYEHPLGTPYYPSFEKGMVEIVDTCACDCHTDPVCDSVHNILDFIAIRNVAFYGADPVIDPNPFCPYEDTDVDCNDLTNVLDLTLMNQVVNLGADPDSTFCDPCPAE